MKSVHLYYFSQGACCVFFLMLSIYFILKTQERLKRLLGLILFLWFLLTVKDLLFLDSDIRANEYYTNLLFSIDLLALPTGTFLLFELLRPKSVSWMTVIVHESILAFPILLYVFIPDILIYYAILIFGLIYGLSIVYFVIQRMKRYNRILEENYSNTDLSNVRWLKITAALLVVCMLTWTFTSLYVTYIGDICYYFSCCCIWGFIAWHTDFQETASEELFREQEISITQINIQCLATQLDELLINNKLYRNPRLTLMDVAKELGTNRTYLSACLKQQLNTTFYDYINAFRLKEVENMFENEKYRSVTIEEIALKCGFNSISTFRRAFFKTYSCTPLQYRKFQFKK